MLHQRDQALCDLVFLAVVNDQRDPFERRDLPSRGGGWDPWRLASTITPIDS